MPKMGGRVFSDDFSSRHFRLLFIGRAFFDDSYLILRFSLIYHSTRLARHFASHLRNFDYTPMLSQIGADSFILMEPAER